MRSFGGGVCTAPIREHEAVEMEILPEDIREQVAVFAGIIAIHAVVGAHESARIGNPESNFKSTQLDPREHPVKGLSLTMDSALARAAVLRETGATARGTDAKDAAKRSSACCATTAIRQCHIQIALSIRLQMILNLTQQSISLAGGANKATDEMDEPSVRTLNAESVATRTHPTKRIWSSGAVRITPLRYWPAPHRRDCSRPLSCYRRSLSAPSPV